MKVRKPVTILFKPRSNFCRQSGIRRNVEKNRTCRPYKAPRPAHDDDRSDETHEGVHPNPPKLTPRHKTNDHQHRDGGVSQYVHKCGAQIVISMMESTRRVRMRLIPFMVRIGVMVVIVIFTQEESTKEVDAQSDHCNRDRLIECNGYWVKKSAKALITDKQRDHRKCDGTCECSQVPELPCSEDEALVPGISTRIGVGQSGDKERTGMGRHVKPVRNKGNRTVPKAPNDLGNHHRCTDSDHGPRLALIPCMRFPEEDVCMAKVFNGVRMHGSVSVSKATNSPRATPVHG